MDFYNLSLLSPGRHCLKLHVKPMLCRATVRNDPKLYHKLPVELCFSLFSILHILGSQVCV